MATRQERRPRSRPVSFELIEQEAVRLFGKKTYPAVGMRDISNAVGILPGSLYVHITNKEELLLRIVAQGIQNYLDAITPVAESTDPPPVRLREAMKAHMQVLAATREQTQVAFHQWTYLSPENQKEVVALRQRYEQLFDRILNDGIKAGDLRRVRNPRVSVLAIIGMLNSATEWFSPTGPLTAEEIGETLADGALLGLQR